MTSNKLIENIAALAYIELSSQDMDSISNSVNTLMLLAEKLRSIDTNDIDPLLHPLDLTQRLRADKITEKNIVEQLQDLAPEFSDQLYLIPKLFEGK